MTPTLSIEELARIAYTIVVDTFDSDAERKPWDHLSEFQQKQVIRGTERHRDYPDRDLAKHFANLGLDTTPKMLLRGRLFQSVVRSLTPLTQ